MTLGQQIKGARENKNLSQEELAELVGVSRQAVSKWENDTSVPHGINRETLSQVLELSDLAEPPVYKTPFHAWIGWGLAALFLLIIIGAAVSFLPMMLMAGQQPLTGELVVESVAAETPCIKSIRFYDDAQREITTEDGWYDIADIDSILVQYSGGVLDSVQVFCTPTGTEMLEYTDLLLTKSVLDNDGVLLLSADVLRDAPPSGHLYFEFNFGREVLSSLTYNVYYEE